METILAVQDFLDRSNYFSLFRDVRGTSCGRLFLVLRNSLRSTTTSPMSERGAGNFGVLYRVQLSQLITQALEGPDRSAAEQPRDAHGGAQHNGPFPSPETLENRGASALERRPFSGRAENDRGVPEQNEQNERSSSHHKQEEKTAPPPTPTVQCHALVPATNQTCKNRVSQASNRLDYCYVHRHLSPTVNLDCPVCLENFENSGGAPQKPFLLSCAHKMHQECLEGLHTPVCPICRRPLTNVAAAILGPIQDRAKANADEEKREADAAAINILLSSPPMWNPVDVPPPGFFTAPLAAPSANPWGASGGYPPFPIFGNASSSGFSPFGAPNTGYHPHQMPAFYPHHAFGSQYNLPVGFGGVLGAGHAPAHAHVHEHVHGHGHPFDHGRGQMLEGLHRAVFDQGPPHAEVPPHADFSLPMVVIAAIASLVDPGGSENQPEGLLPIPPPPPGPPPTDQASTGDDSDLDRIARDYSENGSE